MNQPQLDFTVHRRENNAESQAHLDQNRAKFNRVCQLVFDKLMRGERLTVRQCAIDGISSLPRRIADLRESGVVLSGIWQCLPTAAKPEGEGMVKVYQMAPEQIAANALRFGPSP